MLVADDDSQILRCYRRAFAQPASAENESFDKLAGELFGSDDHKRPGPVFEVVECSQGDQAVAVAETACGRESRFDVVVLDVRMPPGINGVEAGEQIRRMDPDVPIVFVSGYSDVTSDELERRVPPASRLYFYSKPLSFTALAQDIADIVMRVRAG